MTSTSALNTAISGLNIAQKALSVTSDNIANANTDGYTAKTLPQTTTIADGVGVGVQAGEITRYVDQAVQKDYRTQLGLQSFSTTSESYLSRVIDLSGATDAETNIGSALGDLYSQFVSLTATPDAQASQQAVISGANSLAQKINSFSTALSGIRNDAETDLQGQVSSLNASLQQIASLNKTISANKAIGRSTADLEDQRDQAVKAVSQQLNVTYYTDGNGVLVLQTNDGHVLADTSARQVDFTATTLNPTKLYPDPSVGGIIVHDTATGTIDLAAGSPGGSIGALLQVRDQTIPTYNAQLDELAYQTTTRFNDQGLKLFTDNTGAIPANNPAAYAGYAAKMQVNTAIINDPSLIQQGTTGVPIPVGSTAVISNVINYTFGKYKDSSGTLNTPFNTSNTGYNGQISFAVNGNTTATLQDFATSFISGQAADYNTVKQDADTETAYTQTLQTKLLDGSAVNTDQEMTNLIKYQQSYGASAKMITALNDLFTELLNAITG
jgi:flagellar hook-associated protein 1 FlgK